MPSLGAQLDAALDKARDEAKRTSRGLTAALQTSGWG